MKAKTTAELIADYHVLETYDRIRSCKYGDMANTRRGREINRLADAIIDAASGGIVDATGHFPASSHDELVAAWQRVARPRIARVLREDYRHGTRYTQATLDAWQLTRDRLGLV